MRLARPDVGALGAGWEDTARTRRALGPSTRIPDVGTQPASTDVWRSFQCDRQKFRSGDVVSLHVSVWQCIVDSHSDCAIRSLPYCVRLVGIPLERGRQSGGWACGRWL